MNDRGDKVLETGGQTKKVKSQKNPSNKRSDREYNP